MKRARIYLWLLLIAAIVLVDEWLKAIGLQQLPPEGSLVDPGILSFAIHKNYGVAFNLPFKLEFVILFSFIIGAVLAHIAWQHRKTDPAIAFSCLTIIIGAAGNLFDRIHYDFTVDYIILFGRSAINLSDLVILTGVFLLLLATSKQKRDREHH